MALTVSSLKRKIGNKLDARVIYFLYEGKNTEPLFIAPFIENSNYINSQEICFKQFSKTENDEGRTSVEQLVKLAFSYKDNHDNFKKNYDKIIIVFDLDVYKNNQLRMNNIISLGDKDIIFAYTNPSIELFLLLTIKDSYEKIIKPNEKEILENNFINGKRFVNYLFSELTHINSKSKKGEVSLLSSNFEIVIDQEKKFLNHYIDLASFKLTSNLGYVFEKIKNLDFNINYFFTFK